MQVTKRSDMDETKCSKEVWNEFSYPTRRHCSRKVWKDGFCWQHHPENVKERKQDQEKRRQVKLKNHPLIKLLIANAKIAILTKAMQEVIDRYPYPNIPLGINVVDTLKQALQDADNVKEVE